MPDALRTNTSRPAHKESAWQTQSKIGDVERTAEIAAVAGYYSTDGLLDTSVAERGRLSIPPPSARGSWDRAMRKILYSRADPRPAQPERRSVSEEVDSFARANSSPTPKRIGELLRPRRGAAILPSAGFDEGRTADFLFWRRSFMVLPGRFKTQPVEELAKRKGQGGDLTSPVRLPLMAASWPYAASDSSQLAA